MGSNQPQYRLKWNSFHTNLSHVFESMLVQEHLVDCTIACDGASIKAHKMILAASSPYFQTLFIANPCKHPIVILKDVRFADLKSIIDFIYRGEVSVAQDQLSSLLKTAETLKIKGLTEVGDKQTKGDNHSMQMKNKKRKRKRNKSQIQHNMENMDSSDPDDCSETKSRLNDENSFNYRPIYRQKCVTNDNTITVNKDKEMTLSLDDIEPIKLLEQSMSTPENTNEEILMNPGLNYDEEDDKSDLQEIPLMDDNSSSYNQSFEPMIQIGTNNNYSTPQTIEEYERLLTEIQHKNMTTCPVCCKVFIKKSKLVRHYHTHFSNFRPKFSCNSCGKLFTTQDWCKRHALSCQLKVSPIGYD